MLPALLGAPIRVVIRASLGPHWASTSIPKRIVYLDRQVLRERGEFERILIHELFHFAWVRLSNGARREWEQILAAEMRRGIQGELGWSAERRKQKLHKRDIGNRAPAWRHYVRESFCDSAARVYSNLASHDEFTLPPTAVRRRESWLRRIFATNGVRL